MQKVVQITPDNYGAINLLYEDFKSKALIDYRYQYEPIEFDAFTSAIENNLLGGLILFREEIPEGLLIYSPGKFDVTEINVVHSADRFELLGGLIENIKPPGVLSYPMLGVQEESVKDIAHLGFKFVGQSIVKFDFQDPVSYRVLKNSGDMDLQGCQLGIWDDKYRDQAVELIHLAFKNNKVANFDPRFLTLEGTKDVLKMVLSNQYGPFLPGQTRMLLRGETLEGLCFTVLATEENINIPLIALRKDERNKGLGKLLLKSVIGGFSRLISEKKFHLKEINATVDTDNYPAIKMYRRLGFREDYFYPHAYLKLD